MRRIVRVSVGLLVLAVLVSCTAKRSRSGAASGTITYKGQPVNDAALLLYPTKDRAANPITIPVDAEGKFSITDLPPGEYTIVVQGSEGQENEAVLMQNLPPAEKAKMKKMMEGQKSTKTISFPKKYQDLNTTTLKCTLTDKDQPLNLELKD